MEQSWAEHPKMEQWTTKFLVTEHPGQMVGWVPCG
jgi:hypothetical protein